MFTLTCDNCGAESKVVFKQWLDLFPRLQFEGEVFITTAGYDGELKCECNKCGNLISD